MADEDRYERGMRVRREVLGDAHVDRATARVTVIDQGFQRYLTESAWGQVWDDPGLERPTRSLVTVAILAALGRLEELELHLRATRNTGATPEQITQTLMHVAVYAGVPAANTAMAIFKKIAAETGEGAS